jgi:hypothetical protein
VGLVAVDALPGGGHVDDLGITFGRVLVTRDAEGPAVSDEQGRVLRLVSLVTARALSCHRVRVAAVQGFLDAAVTA